MMEQARTGGQAKVATADTATLARFARDSRRTEQFRELLVRGVSARRAHLTAAT